MTDTEPRCPRCGNILRTATHDNLMQAWCEHCQAPNGDLFPLEPGQEPGEPTLPDLKFDTPPTASQPTTDQPAPKLDIETWFEAAPPPWEKPAQPHAPTPTSTTEPTLAHPPASTHASLPVATPLAHSAPGVSEPELLIVTPSAPISEELEIIETPAVGDVDKAKLLEAKLIEPKKATSAHPEAKSAHPEAKPAHPEATPAHADSIPVVRPKPRLSLSHLPEAKPYAERTPTVFRPPHELPDPERPKPRVFMAMIVLAFTTLAFIIGIGMIAFAILYGFRKVSRPKAANPARAMMQQAHPQHAIPPRQP